MIKLCFNNASLKFVSCIAVFLMLLPFNIKKPLQKVILFLYERYFLNLLLILKATKENLRNLIHQKRKNYQ